VYVAGQLVVEGKEYPIFEDLNLPIDYAGKIRAVDEHL